MYGLAGRSFRFPRLSGLSEIELQVVLSTFFD